MEESHLHTNHLVCIEIAEDLSIKKRIELKGIGLYVILTSIKSNL